MPKQGSKRGIYELRDASVGRRFMLAGIAAICVVLAWWILFGNGLETVGGCFGQVWHPGNPLRRASLAAALSIYYIRLLFTWFVFLRRGINWREVFSIAPWLLCIYLLLAILGGTNTTSFGDSGGIGWVMFAAGSWLNSQAEYARHIWKQHQEHRGKLYAQGLFRYSRHPNYLGDLISYSGLWLLSGAWIAASLPLITLAGFVFVNIPALDAHLHEKYGKTFDEYARRTAKLIPFLY